MHKLHCREGIAIVDDEIELTRLYETIFKASGIPVCFVAYNGQEAVELFKNARSRPSVIIMDQRMPVMTGTDAAREIMAIDPGVKIIFVSADEHTREEALKAGAVTFLKKPVSLREIVCCVKSLLQAEA